MIVLLYFRTLIINLINQHIFNEYEHKDIEQSG